VPSGQQGYLVAEAWSGHISHSASTHALYCAGLLVAMPAHNLFLHPRWPQAVCSGDGPGGAWVIAGEAAPRRLCCPCCARALCRTGAALHGGAGPGLWALRLPVGLWRPVGLVLALALVLMLVAPTPALALKPWHWDARVHTMPRPPLVVGRVLISRGACPFACPCLRSGAPVQNAHRTTFLSLYA
jgi:hypothetical protein